MRYTAGIDLGGTNIAVGIVDETFKIVSRASCKTALPRPAEEILSDAVKAIREALEKIDLKMEDLSWIGIGSPGIVNPETGSVDYSCNLDFYDQDIEHYLKEQTGLPVYIDNDANAAAYGEYVAGGAKGASDAVVITLGTGLGGGIIINNKIYSGFNYAGGEIGHTVIQRDGRPCNCGRKGCFETYASATGLIVSTKEEMEASPDSLMWKIAGENGGKVSGRTAFLAMKQGDEAGKRVVDRYISDLACGVTNLINTFSPEVFCIGGGISKEGDALIKPLVEIVSKEVYSRFSKKQTSISTAKLENDAGIIGAASLGLQFE